jgi:DNA-binding transcriptional ArsR family regulator
MATILSRTSSPSQTTNGFPLQTENSPDSAAALPETISKELVRWFKLLADETRLRILFFLLEKNELNVRTLCDLLGLSQPAVSHHLALLRVDGLIDCRREGKHNYYRILPERFGKMMDMVVSVVPGKELQRRVADYLVTFTRPDENE